MAFFGLTALGSQNSFSAASIRHRNLQIFEDSDFLLAWERVNGRSAKYCKTERIPEIFRALFRGDVPKTDQDPLRDGFMAVESFETITFDAYMKTMTKLRREAEEQESQYEGKPNPDCEFISSQEFAESLRKNAAMKKSLQTKLTMPLTAMQEVSKLFHQNFYYLNL